jgi:hypothetical protein
VSSPILGCDVRAALRGVGDGAAAERLGALLGDDEAVGSYEDLTRRCPPEALGITPGAHAAALAPLFGEFE